MKRSMKKSINPTRHATPTEAQRGIYIDFECMKDEPPALVGVLLEDHFEQIVFDPVLQPASMAKHLRTNTLEAEIRRLLDLCESQGRCVFAFTRHELNVTYEYTILGVNLEDFYRDGHKIAKRWFNILHHGESIDGWRLQDFQKFTRQPRPAYLGNQKAAKSIRDVRNMLIRRKEYERLTPVAKGKWTRLLDYNRLDCIDLREIVLLATEELREQRKG